MVIGLWSALFPHIQFLIKLRLLSFQHLLKGVSNVPSLQFTSSFLLGTATLGHNLPTVYPQPLNSHDVVILTGQFWFVSMSWQVTSQKRLTIYRVQSTYHWTILGIIVESTTYSRIWFGVQPCYCKFPCMFLEIVQLSQTFRWNHQAVHCGSSPPEGSLWRDDLNFRWRNPHVWWRPSCIFT